MKRDVDTAEIVRRRMAGETCLQIGQALGLSKVGVWQRLRRTGLSFPPVHRARRRPDVDTAEIVRRYASGETLAQLRDALGMSVHSIRERMQAAGVECRPPGKRKRG